MSAQILFTLLLFAFVASITPGPNNFMLLTSGVKFGLRKTLPHMLGICSGVFFLLLAIGLGLGALLKAAPALYLLLKFGGAAYLLYLAWKIITAPPREYPANDAEGDNAGSSNPPCDGRTNTETHSGGADTKKPADGSLAANTPAQAAKGKILATRPMRFIESFAFQWVNVKAWVTALNAMANYTAPADYLQTVLLVCVIFAVVTFPCVAVWTLFGTLLRQWLAKPRRQRIFNMIMGVLLAASLWPMLS